MTRIPDAPMVSVVMAVRNGQAYLRDAMDSILSQTLADFELIVVDDGSTDRTPDILEDYARRDCRVRVLSQAPQGLSEALNRAISAARGKYIARMDADDVALRERLARQVAFMETHPDVGLLGTAVCEVDPDGRPRAVFTMPGNDEQLRRALIKFNPFFHSSVMIRRSVLEQVGLYSEEMRWAEDYDLWMRLARHTRLANLQEVLLKRRTEYGGSHSVRHEREQVRHALAIRWRAIRMGMYPITALPYLIRPVLMLVLPASLRRSLRSWQRRRGRIVRT